MEIFCDTYGLDTTGALDTIALRIELMIETGVAGNANGEPRFGEFWMTVMRQRLLRDLAFVRSFGANG
jgi:hypothetical protein